MKGSVLVGEITRPPYNFALVQQAARLIYLELWNQPHPKQKYLDEIADKRVFAAVDDEGIVQAAATVRSEWEGVFELDEVAVLHTARRQGYGRKIIKEVEDTIRQNGGKELALYALVPARPFFDTLGYEATKPDGGGSRIKRF
jgi:N-acetylglutamate synthase-like GNAT family acetyltransferase